MNVTIDVLNCQKCRQCLSGHGNGQGDGNGHDLGHGHDLGRGHDNVNVNLNVFVFVFVFVIVFLLVRSCLLITLLTFHKVHKYLRVLSCSVFQQ